MPLSSVCMYVCMYVVNIFNIFSSETTGPIKVKFHMKHLWDGAMKICSTGPDMVKILKNLLLWHQKVDNIET